MKRNFLKIVLVVTAVFWGAFVSQDTPFSKTVHADDKALEKLFQDSAEIARTKPDGKGCESIPYSDLRRQCSDPSEIRDAQCKDGKEPENCNAQAHDLINASARKDKKRIEKLRRECLERIAHADTCVTARNAIQIAFTRAAGRMERDRANFETKRKSTKGTEQAFYQRMVGYSDTILAYYADEKKGHGDQLSQLHRLKAKCQGVVTDADEALERMK